MLKEQKHQCAICSASETKYKYGLVVDHCHASGYVRGLLCPFCNRKIVGNAAEDYFRTVGLIKYLQAQVKGDIGWKQKSLVRRARNARKKKN